MMFAKISTYLAQERHKKTHCGVRKVRAIFNIRVFSHVSRLADRYPVQCWSFASDRHPSPQLILYSPRRCGGSYFADYYAGNDFGPSPIESYSGPTG